MAHLLRLNYGGTALNLYETTGSECYLLANWVPAAPAPGATFVHDVIPLAITTSTADLVRAKVRGIERILGLGRDWTTSSGYAGTYTVLEIQPDAAGTVYRSDVYDGWVEWDADSLCGRWAAKDVTIRVHVVRAPWWETPTVTALSATSHQTTVAAATATIYNPSPTYTANIAAVNGDAQFTDAANGLAFLKDGDTFYLDDTAGPPDNTGTYTVATGGGGHDGYVTVTVAPADKAATGITIVGPPQNWVQVASAQAANTLPTPLYIAVQNTTNDADELTTHWIGSNVWANPTTLTPAIYTLEGEEVSATEADGGEADTADATNSGGYYNEISESGDAEVVGWRFDLSAATTQLFKGRKFRVIMRAGTTAAGKVNLEAAYVRVAVGYPTGTNTPSELGTGETVLLDASDLYQDLGEIYLPPWLPRYGVAASAAVSVLVYVQKAGGFTLAVDYFQLLCMDSFRVYEPQTGGVEYEEYLVDYPRPYEETYIYNVGTGKRALVATRGESLWLYPGQDQRIYIVALNADGLIGRSMSVALGATLRRPTL